MTFCEIPLGELYTTGLPERALWGAAKQAVEQFDPEESMLNELGVVVNHGDSYVHVVGAGNHMVAALAEKYGLWKKVRFSVDTDPAYPVSEQEIDERAQLNVDSGLGLVGCFLGMCLAENFENNELDEREWYYRLYGTD